MLRGEVEGGQEWWAGMWVRRDVSNFRNFTRGFTYADEASEAQTALTFVV